MSWNVTKPTCLLSDWTASNVAAVEDVESPADITVRLATSLREAQQHRRVQQGSTIPEVRFPYLVQMT